MENRDPHFGDRFSSSLVPQLVGVAMWWRADQLAVVDAAIATAAAGSPTLLWIDGEAGQGKSSLLAEVVRRAAGFSMLRADGFVDTREVPYGLFEQWGVGGRLGDDISPFQAAQVLREAIDQRVRHGSVLICVDDFHWADAESVASLTWVLRRAAGDRLLMACAGRPQRASGRSGWRQVLLDPRSTHVTLDGLWLPEALAFVAQIRPGLDSALARRLWAHTGGNPLYLGALLTEHTPDELTAAAVLPAPGDLTVSTAARLERFPPQAADLVRAVAVLGESWSALRLSAHLADVADPLDAASTAIEGGLLEESTGDGGTLLRVRHALLRSAVHAGIPADRRRKLHLRAAELVVSRRDVLWHRIQAADHYDDGLAVALAVYAGELHARGSFREAATQLRWASEVTADSSARERRWLDGLFEHVLARDDEEVSHVLSEVGWASDAVRRTLVLAGLAIITRRWLEARHLMDGLTDEQLAAADPRPRWRLVVLRGWSRVMTGPVGSELVAELATAVEDPARDDALYGYLSFALAQATIAVRGPSAALADLVDAAAPSKAVETTRLAWRGSLFAIAGRFDDAVEILTEVTHRARDRVSGFGDGVFHAYLGYAQWMRGDWAAAGRTLGLAADARFGAEHPMVAATAPLTAIARNDVDAALDALRQARRVLLAAPWRHAVQTAAVTAVLTRRLHGSDAERGKILSQLRGSFGDSVTEPSQLDSPFWLVHLAFAAVWAGEVELASALAERLARSEAALEWLAAGASWIQGLAAERHGDLTVARTELQTAGEDGTLARMPLYRALLDDDLARVHSAVGHARSAATVGRRARDRLATLGLVLTGADRDTDRSGPGVLDSLSARERDVVNLVAEGLSSAQIARELFVTRSTVTFHLSRVFAKTNTANRHELADLVRAGTN